MDDHALFDIEEYPGRCVVTFLGEQLCEAPTKPAAIVHLHLARLARAELLTRFFKRTA